MLIFLIGPKGAGKTTLGRRAAEVLGVPFYDTDDMAFEAVNANAPEHGYGLLSFASAMNSESLNIARRLKDIPAPAIVATGAEFALNPTCATYMIESGKIVNIIRPADKITDTFEQANDKGPLWVEVNTGQEFYPDMRAVELYAAEAPAYKRLASFSVDNAGPLDKSADALVTLIKKILAEN